jgi:hypothetical protein
MGRFDDVIRSAQAREGLLKLRATAMAVFDLPSPALLLGYITNQELGRNIEISSAPTLPLSSNTVYDMADDVGL